jgi:pimeloyl-ACP methyl ester carboxylesterase
MLIRMFKFTLALLFLLFIASVLISHLYKKNISIPATLEGQHVDIDGIKLRVLQAGTGPDVLFLHGSIGSLEDFDSVMPELTKDFRVTTFDRIGHGYSDTPTVTANIASNASYTSKLIQQLDLRDVIVVAHSYGGSIALKLAIEQTPQIKGYVLMAPAAYSLASTRPIEHVLATPAIGKGLLFLLRPVIATPMLRDGLLTSLSPNESLFNKSFIDFRINMWNNTGILHTRVQQTSTVTEELDLMSKAYANIKQPVYVLLGKQEPYADIDEGSKRLVKVVPNSKLVLLNNTGHYLQYVQPQAVIDAIRQISNL